MTRLVARQISRDGCPSTRRSLLDQFPQHGGQPGVGPADGVLDAGGALFASPQALSVVAGALALDRAGANAQLGRLGFQPISRRGGGRGEPQAARPRPRHRCQLRWQEPGGHLGQVVTPPFGLGNDLSGQHQHQPERLDRRSALVRGGVGGRVSTAKLDAASRYPASNTYSVPASERSQAVTPASPTTWCSSSSNATGSPTRGTAAALTNPPPVRSGRPQGRPMWRRRRCSGGAVWPVRWSGPAAMAGEAAPAVPRLGRRLLGAGQVVARVPVPDQPPQVRQQSRRGRAGHVAVPSVCRVRRPGHVDRRPVLGLDPVGRADVEHQRGPALASCQPA